MDWKLQTVDKTLRNSTILYDSYWTFRWESHLKYLFLFLIASWHWFLTYTKSNFRKTFFGLRGLWVFFESFYSPYIYNIFCLFVLLFMLLSSQCLQALPRNVSANIYVFKVSNRNTGKKCNMFKVNN